VTSTDTASPLTRASRSMKVYLFSFVVGCFVGGLYASLRVKSPAPPLVALLGLLGILIGEESYPWLARFLVGIWK